MESITTTKASSLVEIENRAHATIGVKIVDGHIESVRIGYTVSHSGFLYLRDDAFIDPIMAIIELRNQLNEVIEECQIYLSPPLVVDKDSPIAGKLP